MTYTVVVRGIATKEGQPYNRVNQFLCAEYDVGTLEKAFDVAAAYTADLLMPFSASKLGPEAQAEFQRSKTSVRALEGMKLQPIGVSVMFDDKARAQADGIKETYIKQVPNGEFSHEFSFATTTHHLACVAEAGAEIANSRAQRQAAAEARVQADIESRRREDLALMNEL